MVFFFSRLAVSFGCHSSLVLLPAHVMRQAVSQGTRSNNINNIHKIYKKVIIKCKVRRICCRRNALYCRRLWAHIQSCMQHITLENERQRTATDFNAVKEKINLNRGIKWAQNIQHVIIKLCGSFRKVRLGFFLSLSLRFTLLLGFFECVPLLVPSQIWIDGRWVAVVKSRNFHNSLPSYFTLCVIRLVWFSPCYVPFDLTLSLSSLFGSVLIR